MSPPIIKESELESLEAPKTHSESPRRYLNSVQGAENLEMELKPLEITPIAIVGMSMKFPDGANSADSFWSMLQAGRCASREFPPTRLNGSSLFHPDPNRTSSISLKGGHFINEDIDSFDAPFFSISASEATAMDPQSRMLLETTYRALENAGIPISKVSNSKTSVYSGSFSTDYSNITGWDLENGSKYSLIGSSSSLSGRLSWFFNLLGPNLTLDTACSSSLVALDLGCQSLLSRASNMSIVTGSNLLFSPQLFHLLGNFGMLSPDSKCYSFDHRGNGYGRGEGIASIIIKRLSDAIRDNDTIRAVIRSTGTNHDGRTPGMSQPSKSSQALLIRETYANAGLSMLPTRYFEAHGTGTPVGDPIEAAAIGEAFQRSRTPEDPMFVSSVKSNIGHLEGTSGLASIIKAVLVLERGIIPPATNFERLNERIDAQGLNIRIPVTSTTWPAKGLRRISVNSFGASGTNAHVVLDDAYHHLKDNGLDGNHCTISDAAMLAETNLTAAIRNGVSAKSRSNLETPRVVVLSASEKAALKRMFDLYNDWIQDERARPGSAGSTVDDLAYTLNVRRSRLQYRSFAILNDLHEIQNFASLASPPMRTIENPQCAFVFTGQGAQWSGMGRELLRFPTFRANVLESSTYLSQLGCTLDLLSVLIDDQYESALNRPLLSQTLCTVLQIAICDLYQSINLIPFAVVGHSSGEIAAAYCIGAISKRSALQLSYYRGVVAEQASYQASGGMMVIAMSAEKARTMISNINSLHPTPELFLACINSTQSVTISGNQKSLDELAATLQKQNVFHRRLQVDAAYHSPYMKPYSVDYRKLLNSFLVGPISPRSTVMISSVTGEVVNHATLQQADYWIENMLQPVRFLDAVTRLCYPSEQTRHKRIDGSHRNFVAVQVLVEVGPHAALRGPLQDTLKSRSDTALITYCSSIQRRHPADRTFLLVVGYMACQGFDVLLNKANRLDCNDADKSSARRVLSNLPEYPFDSSRKYWVKGRLGNEYRFRRHHKLDLLGKPVIDWNPLEPRWQNFLKFSEMPWVGDHKIDGAVIYPAAGMMIMAIEASKQIVDKSRTIKAFKLTDNQFPVGLVVPATPEGIGTQLVLYPAREDTDQNSSSWEYRLYSCERDQWKENCRGRLQVLFEHDSNEVNNQHETEEVVERYSRMHSLAEKSSKWTRTNEEFYNDLWNSGYTFGPSFRIMDRISFSDDQCLHATANVNCFQWRETENANHYQEHIVHPTTLDGIFQTTLALYSRAGVDIMPTSVPVQIDELWISGSGLSFPQTSSVKSRGWLNHRGNVGYDCDVIALDNSSRKVLVHAKCVRLRHVTKGLSPAQEPKEPQICYNIQWKPDLALMSPELINFGSGRSQIVDGGTVQQISSLLELATFKSPGMRIMQISESASSTGSYSSELLRGMFIHKSDNEVGLPYKDFTLVELPEPYSNETREGFEKEQRFNSVSWSQIHDAEGKITEPESFELILGPKSAELSELIPSISTLLKPGGRVILFRDDISTPEDVSKDHLQDALEDKDFENVQTYHGVRSTSEIAIIATKPLKAPSTYKSIRYVLLIEHGSEYQRSLAQILGNALHEASISCQVSNISDLENSDINAETMYIFLPELEHPILEVLTSEMFSHLKRIFLSTKRLLWLTRQTEDRAISPCYGMIDGLAGTLRSENSGTVIVTASLEPKSTENQVGDIFTLIRGIFPDPTSSSYETHYRQIKGLFNIARIIPAHRTSLEVHKKSLSVQHKTKSLRECPQLKLTVATPGLLDSLQFEEDSAYHEPLAPDEVEIQTQYVGLNFKDLLVALGRVNSATFGNECAGTISRAGVLTDFKPGERVCVFHSTTFNTHTRAKSEHIARIPEKLPLSHAVSVVIQFTTAYYALHHLAKLQKRQTVLIHSGAGGTGQACIQIAQNLGGVVFTTVSSDQKKRLLMEEYGIPETHIFYSRDTSFAEGIKEATNHRGVDVIINSLSGESLLASWNIIASNGRFIELSRKDIEMNTSLPMRPFQRGATFTALESSMVAAEFPILMRQIVEHLLMMMAKESIHPVYPFQVMPISDLEKGMRMLQAGNTMGKIVLEYNGDVHVPILVKTKPSSSFDANKTYVIAGGTGGIGRAIAMWMAERGAKHLLIISRSGMRNKDAAETIHHLRQSGLTIEAPECDIRDRKGLADVLERCRHSMPVIGGCIQASMVLKDVVFANMTYKDWQESIEVKTTGSWNLHTLLPTGLDFFVLLSSVAGILGSTGQANYAAGNTYLDALAHYRVAQGERAISLDLGAVLEHGVVALDDALRKRLLSGGYIQGISPPELFGLFDFCFTQTDESQSQEDSQIVYGLARPSQIRAKILQAGRSSMTLPFYNHVLTGGLGDGPAQGNDAERLAVKHRKSFLSAETEIEAGNVAAMALIEKLVPGALSRNDEDVDGDLLARPIYSYGVDSLVAVELRSWFAAEFSADIPVFHILGDKTVTSIGNLVALKSRLRRAVVKD